MVAGDLVVETNELGPVLLEGQVRNGKAVLGVGCLEILCGLAIVALELTTLIMFYESGAPGYLIEFAGLWAGVFAVITGIVHVLAARNQLASQTRCWFFLGGIGAALACMVQALVMAGLTCMNIYLVRSEITRREVRSYQVTDELTVDRLKDLAMLKSVLGLIYIVLAIATMIAIGLGCCNVCAKPTHDADQVVYSSVDGKQVKQIKIFRKNQHIKA